MRFEAVALGVLVLLAFGCSSGDDDSAASGNDAGDRARPDAGAASPPAGSVPGATASHGMDAATKQTPRPAAAAAVVRAAGLRSRCRFRHARRCRLEQRAISRATSTAPWAGGPAYYAKFATVRLRTRRSFRSRFGCRARTAHGLRRDRREHVHRLVGRPDRRPTLDAGRGRHAGRMRPERRRSRARRRRRHHRLDATRRARQRPVAAPRQRLRSVHPRERGRSRYDAIKAKDASRPVFLNLGQGVAHDYIGWGNECAATHPATIPTTRRRRYRLIRYLPVERNRGRRRRQALVRGGGREEPGPWSAGKKPVWNWIECTGIDDPSRKPTPEQVKAEVWMSIVAGSMGIGYFVHQFNPSFDEHALLDDDTMKAAVAAINQQITDLAPVLNEKPVTNGGSVMSDNPDVPITMLLKRHAGATYIFAVAMRGTAVHATFSGLTHIASGASAT